MFPVLSHRKGKETARLLTVLKIVWYLIYQFSYRLKFFKFIFLCVLCCYYCNNPEKKNEKMLINLVEKQPKKEGVELYLPTWGTGIPDNDKRAHARVVSKFTYHLVDLKITSFQVEILSNSF